MGEYIRHQYIFLLDDLYFAWRTIVDGVNMVKGLFVSPNPTPEQRKFVRTVCMNVTRVK